MENVYLYCVSFTDEKDKKYCETVASFHLAGYIFKVLNSEKLQLTEVKLKPEESENGE